MGGFALSWWVGVWAGLFGRGRGINSEAVEVLYVVRMWCFGESFVVMVTPDYVNVGGLFVGISSTCTDRSDGWIAFWRRHERAIPLCYVVLWLVVRGVLHMWDNAYLR